MKPDIKSLKSLRPEAETLLAEHLSRLDERYFKIFSKEDLDRHFRALASLSPHHPVEVLLALRKDGTMDCTVLAFDYPSEFSLLAQINASIADCISPADRLLFFKLYAQGSPLIRQGKKYFQAIIEIGRKKNTKPYGLTFPQAEKPSL